jgi:cation:H+ antiporter
MTVLIIAQWVVMLAVSLYVLIKGADVFLDGAKQVGRSLGMSTFAIGILIVGFGTSLPELASSIAAVLQGSTELAAANVVGSNVTNILLIIGLGAVVAGRIMFNQDILKTELPLFVISQAILVAVVIDGAVDRIEAGFLLAVFGAYLWYIMVESKQGEREGGDVPKISPALVLTMLIGLGAVLVGAHYTVEMAVNIATALAVPIGLVSITAVAVGTSLPELMVTLQSVRKRDMEVAVGNIFGSNTFNALVVMGIPALIAPLVVDTVVLGLGLWYMLAASLMIFVIGLSRQVMRWEGLMMLIFFAFFLTKLAVFL